MEASGRRVRIALACLGSLVLGAGGAWVLGTLAIAARPVAPVVVAPAAPEPPAVDVARLHTLDHLVLVGDPVLDLTRPPAPSAAVGSGPPGPAPVPEPGPATLWILGWTALCALYLPARSW